MGVVEIERALPEGSKVLRVGKYGCIFENDGKRAMICSPPEVFGPSDIIPKDPRLIVEEISQRFLEGFRPLIFWTGPMHGGKTLAQVSLARVAQSQGKECLLIRPANGRSQEPALESFPGQIIQPETQSEILSAIKLFGAKGEVLMLDEMNLMGFLGQKRDPEFFAKLRQMVFDKINDGCLISASLLDRDFTNSPFPPFLEFFSLASDFGRSARVFRLKSRCICGLSAEVSNRVSIEQSCPDGRLLCSPVSLKADTVGVENWYIPLCEGCFRMVNKLDG
jgi:thymidine kinase